MKVEYDYSSAYSSTIYHSTVGSLYDAVTLPGKVTGLKQERWYYFINQFNAVWTKQEGATGYDVYVSTKPTTGYKRVKSVGKSTYSATISKLSGKKFSSKKKYYVYIVTKKKVGKVTHKSGRLYYWNTKSPVSSFGYF